MLCSAILLPGPMLQITCSQSVNLENSTLDCLKYSLIQNKFGHIRFREMGLFMNYFDNCLSKLMFWMHKKNHLLEASLLRIQIMCLIVSGKL